MAKTNPRDTADCTSAPFTLARSMRTSPARICSAVAPGKRSMENPLSELLVAVNEPSPLWLPSQHAGNGGASARRAEKLVMSLPVPPAEQ